MKMSKAKMSEAERFESVGEKFDVIFDQLPSIESFTIKVGTKWPDPHVPEPGFLSEPEFRLKINARGGKSISESTRSSLEFLVEKILIGERLIRRGEFEYASDNKNAMNELNGSVFKKGFRMSPMEEIFEELFEAYDEEDEPDVESDKNKFGW